MKFIPFISLAEMDWLCNDSFFFQYYKYYIKIKMFLGWLNYIVTNIDTKSMLVPNILSILGLESNLERLTAVRIDFLTYYKTTS